MAKDKNKNTKPHPQPNPDVFDEANYYKDNQHELGGEDRKKKEEKDKKNPKK